MYDSTVKYLYAYEKEALFSAIDADTTKYRIRNKAIFLITEYCGLRASEVGLIRMDDLNLDRQEIYIKRLKGSNNNTLRIVEPRVLHALDSYLTERKKHHISSDFLFVSQKGTPISRKRLDELMKYYCRLANIPHEKAHMHALKHTRAISLAELGLDTKDVQYWIGHKSIKNTEIYLQFTTTQQEILYQKLIRAATP